MIHFLKRSLCIATLVFSAMAGAVAPSESDTAAQRALFLQTRAKLQANLPVDAADVAALRGYALFPYIEQLQLTRSLAAQDSDAIDDFLRRNDNTPAADQLRNQWLSLLAENDRWNDYLRYYRSANASRVQQCWQIEALHRSGADAAALRETEKLWLSIDNPDACDAALARWLASPARNEALVWKRLLLMLDKKQETAARALVTQMREPYKTQAEFALLLLRDPSALENLLPQLVQHVEASPVIALALEGIARRDALAATAQWQRIAAQNILQAEDSAAVRQEIGRQLIAAGDPAALDWLLQYDPHGADAYLLEWRIRLALLNGNWPLVERSIESLPAELANSSRWNYWLARALSEQRDAAAKQQRAAELFAALANERSFFGFLAADRQKTPYRLNDEPLRAAVPLDAIAVAPGIARAREFLALGELAGARREWQYATRALAPAELQSAALLAAELEWHDQAIRSANQSGAYNDIRLRFPLGYREAMNDAARNTGLPIQWLYAITRQESAFMSDARSAAGALGLMQLMPATARHVARGRIGSDELLRPAANIQLGSTYLNDMLRRFDGNRVLATAAYNAGPTRIGRMLKNQDTAMAADVWIETLPYKETREYVQSVLAFAVIYGERLGKPIPLLRDSERRIGSDVALSAAGGCQSAPDIKC